VRRRCYTVAVLRFEGTGGGCPCCLRSKSTNGRRISFSRSVQPSVLHIPKRGSFDFLCGTTVRNETLTSSSKRRLDQEGAYVFGVQSVETRHVHCTRGNSFVSYTLSRNSSRVNVILPCAGGGLLHNGSTRRMSCPGPPLRIDYVQVERYVIA
jgi:hypothetical protein